MRAMVRPSVVAALLALASAGTLVCFSFEARADDTAAADALFEEGKVLRDAGKWAEACPKFEASFDLSKTLGTLMSVADCRENNHDLVQALDGWDRAIELAKSKADERISFAQERRQKLEPRVPRLSLDIKQGSEKLSIFIDGKELPELKWGLPVLVDPGKVSIEVRRDGDTLESRTVDVEEGKSTPIALDLAAIAKAKPSKKATPVEPANPAQRIAGIVTLSVGLAGVVAFAVLEGVAVGKRSDANRDDGCFDDGENVICSPEGYAEVQQAGDLAEVGQWLGIGGLTLAAVGLTVFLTAPKDAPASGKAGIKAQILPWFVPTEDGAAGGLVVRGTL